MIKDITRSWPGQVDSTIDHFWTNLTQKIIKIENEVKAVDDHNMILATLRLKGGIIGGWKPREGLLNTLIQ